MFTNPQTQRYFLRRLLFFGYLLFVPASLLLSLTALRQLLSLIVDLRDCF